MLSESVATAATGAALREWQRWSGNLPHPQVAALVRARPPVVDVRLRPDGGCELTAKQWVGAGLYEGFDLRIRPKVPAASILALLGDDLDRLNLVDHGLLGVETELQELLGHAYLSAVAQILRRGLRRDYVPREDVLAFARGRVDVRLTSLEHLQARARIACRFEEFEQDGPTNRALAFVLHQLLRRPGLFSVQLRRKASEVARALPSPLVVTPAGLDRMAVESRDYFYRAAIKLGALLLRGLGFSDAGTAHESNGFWIDMNRLFQDFVARAVRGGLRQTECVVSEEPTRYLDREQLVNLKPDVMVRRGQAELPIDAKYKNVREPEGSDVYQVLAYCRGLGSLAGIIVMPGTWAPRRIQCRGGEEIWTVSLDLGSRERMAQSTRTLTELALSLLPRTQAHLRPPPSRFGGTPTTRS